MNWDAVFDIIARGKAPEWDREIVALAVEEAYKTWFQADERDTILSVEVYGREPWPYKIDIVKRRHEDGRLVLCDWKTKAAGKLDETWELREKRSPQSRIYGAAAADVYGTHEFPIMYEVRGVLLAEKPKTKTISMTLEEADAAEAVRHLRDQTAMRDTLVEREKTPWVKNPAGCRIYGPAYKCEFEEYCWGGLTPPEGIADKPLSHSSAKEFLRCPERYRLINIMEKPEDDQTTAAGSLFHEAMETAYRQLIKQENE